MRLLWPIAQLKQILQAFYELLLSRLWAELTQRQQRTSTGATLLLSGVFAVLSLFVYYTRDHDLLIFVSVLLLWAIDVSLAKGHYAKGKHHKQLWLKILPNEAEITLQHANGEQQQTQFVRTQALRIEIVQAAVRGGAFQEKLGWVWRVYLVRRDHSRCLVYEKRQAIAALRGAKQLSRQFFQVPIVFAHSEGLGPYAATPLDPNLHHQYQQNLPSTLQRQTSAGQWHLCTQWNHRSFSHMAGEVLRQSGFLLFLIIVANLLQFAGGILHATVITSFAQPIGANITFEAMAFELDLPDLIEGGFALALIMFKGFQVSQEDHVLIDPKQLTFRLNNRPIGQLNTTTIETVVYVKSPQPCLLICDRHEAIQLDSLQTEEEFRALMVALNGAIAHFASKPNLDVT